MAHAHTHPPAAAAAGAPAWHVFCIVIEGRITHVALDAASTGDADGMLRTIWGALRGRAPDPVRARLLIEFYRRNIPLVTGAELNRYVRARAAASSDADKRESESVLKNAAERAAKLTRMLPHEAFAFADYGQWHELHEPLAGVVCASYTHIFV